MMRGRAALGNVRAVMKASSPNTTSQGIRTSADADQKVETTLLRQRLLSGTENCSDFRLFTNIKFRIVSPDRPLPNANIAIDKTANICTH